MGEGDKESLWKSLPKLNCAEDYVLWRRRVYAYLRRSDFELLCFAEAPENNSAAARKKWQEAVAKAKGDIVLLLGKAPLASCREIIDDDDRSAKELWDEIKKLYTSSNAQAILNLQHELEILVFKEDQVWEKHVERFLEILGKLASYDVEIPSSEKASKLLRTLPESFAPLAMVSQTTDITFDKIFVAVHGELSRRKNMKSRKSDSAPTAAAVKPNTFRSSDQRGPQSGRIQKSQRNRDQNCFVCGKRGHYAADCWNRQDANFNNYRGGRGGRFRGRGRGRFRGRGSFNNFRGAPIQSHQPYQAQGWQNYNQPPGPQGNGYFSNLGAPQANHFGTLFPDSQPPQPPTSNSNNQNPQGRFRYGFMAKLKFRSTTATVREEKDNKALLDSGATHHFFHSKSFFSTYVPMTPEEVMSASGTSEIVGRGQVLLPLHGGVYVEAYHTPHFSSNILSIARLSQLFDFLFSSRDVELGSSKCTIMLKNTGTVIFETEDEEGLFKFEVVVPSTAQCSSFGTTVPPNIGMMTIRIENGTTNLVVWSAQPQFNRALSL